MRGVFIGKRGTYCKEKAKWNRYGNLQNVLKM